MSSNRTSHVVVELRLPPGTSFHLAPWVGETLALWEEAGYSVVLRSTRETGGVELRQWIAVPK